MAYIFTCIFYMAHGNKDIMIDSMIDIDWFSDWKCAKVATINSGTTRSRKPHTRFKGTRPQVWIENNSLSAWNRWKGNDL